MTEPLMAKCSCSQCGNHIEFPADAAGMAVACPHCGQNTELHFTAPPPRADRFSAAELVAAIQGSVPRTRASFFYQAGLLLVTFTMLLLPLIYIGLIALAGWGWFYFAVHCKSVMNPVHGGGSRMLLLQALAYFGPLFIGGILILCMVKPLFARRPHHAQPLAMNPGAEPTLYAFIARICDAIGAPMPRRIDLDCQLNASAGFRRGAWSMLGNDLVLTIGLPLVAGLNLREFAGVIAHEFGHFTQGFGMRLSYVIRSVNAWFGRVVYERDALDQWLADLSEDSESEEWGIMLVAGCARLAVGFSRLFLGLLMYLGHGVSCFLLRHMEYDADIYSMRLAGSATFETTSQRLAVLGEATKRAYHQMETQFKRDGQLPESFPASVVFFESRMPAPVKEKIKDTLGLATTGVFDTHPSDGDRIRRARQAGEPGIFNLDLPATVLFSNFEIAARQVSHLHYTDDLGIEIDPASVAHSPSSAPVETA